MSLWSVHITKTVPALLYMALGLHCYCGLGLVSVWKHTHHTRVWRHTQAHTLFYHSPEVVAGAYPLYQDGEAYLVLFTWTCCWGIPIIPGWGGIPKPIPCSTSHLRLLLGHTHYTRMERHTLFYSHELVAGAYPSYHCVETYPSSHPALPLTWGCCWGIPIIPGWRGIRSNHLNLLLGHTHHTRMWRHTQAHTLLYHSPEVVAGAYPLYQDGEANVLITWTCCWGIPIIPGCGDIPKPTPWSTTYLRLSNIPLPAGINKSTPCSTTHLRLLLRHTHHTRVGRHSRHTRSWWHHTRTHTWKSKACLSVQLAVRFLLIVFLTNDLCMAIKPRWLYCRLLLRWRLWLRF